MKLLNKYKVPGDILLESGTTLQSPTIAYHSYGTLNKHKDNVVWVCHALTANSDVFDWWKGLFGEEDYFNPKDHFIICANILGSHYGTTSPLDEDPSSGKRYYHDFPQITIRDMVGLHRRLADHLGIDDIRVLIGGSLGGQQALEWSIEEVDRIKNLILLATNAVHSPWGVAFNASQRMAIANDPTWMESKDDAGRQGLITARSIALLSYRNHGIYSSSQAENKEVLYPQRAGSYQQYQGEKLAKRFNAFSYWHLSLAMDSHNIARNREEVEVVLSTIKARTLVVSIENDLLFPTVEQLRISRHINNATHVEISSVYSHDGFLLETEILSQVISNFLKSKSLHKDGQELVTTDIS